MGIEKGEIIIQLEKIYSMLTTCPDGAQRQCIDCKPIIDAALAVRELQRNILLGKG